jgi:hypothetical protein
VPAGLRLAWLARLRLGRLGLGGLGLGRLRLERLRPGGLSRGHPRGRDPPRGTRPEARPGRRGVGPLAAAARAAAGLPFRLDRHVG